MTSGSRIHQKAVVPGQRITYGPFGEIGYVLKNPDYVAMASNRIQIQRYKNRERLFRNSEDFKALKHEAFLSKCHDRLDVIKVRSAADRFVDLGMREAENELERKRNKLRKSLLEEESKYVAEYTVKAQTALERRLEKVMKKVEDIEKRAKISDSLLAERAYMKLAMENDEEIRNHLRIKRLNDTAECLKAQICEKEYAVDREKEEERLWELMDQERIKTERDTEKRARELKTRQRVELAEMLDKQIEAQEFLKDNRKCLEELEEIGMKEYNDRICAEYDMRDRVLKDKLTHQAHILLRQIEEDRRKAESRRHEDIMEERILLEDAHRKNQRAEAARVDDRDKSRAELNIFREAVTQYRNAVAEEEAKIDSMINEEKKRNDRNFILAQKEKATQRKNFVYLCAQEQKHMAAQNVVKKAQARDLDEKYNQLFGYRNEANRLLDKEHDLYRPRVDHPRNVAQQNEHNENYLNVLRRRQAAEDQEMIAKMRNSRNEMQSKIMQAVNKPLPEIMGTSLHPFYTYIRARAS